MSIGSRVGRVREDGRRTAPRGAAARVLGAAVLALFAAAGLAAGGAWAGGEYDNVAFRKDVPPEWRQKFPMCDEFLDIRWIDEKRYLGLLKANVYEDAVKSPEKYFLAILEPPRSRDMLSRNDGILYEITADEYASGSFAEFMRKAKLKYAKGFFFLDVMLQGKTRDLMQYALPRVGIFSEKQRSYARASKNVCAAYPDAPVAIVVEPRMPFLAGAQEEKEDRDWQSIVGYVRARCEAIGKAELATRNYSSFECIENPLQDARTLDANFDGKADYVFSFSVGLTPKDRLFPGARAKPRGGLCIETGGALRFWDWPKRAGVGRFLSIDAAIPAVLVDSCNLTSITR